MKKLMVVDDEREMEDFYLLTFEEELERKSLILDFHSDSRQLLDLFNKGFDYPDLIVCDINLPYVSGIELIKTLREKNISTTVFFVSGFDEFQFEKEIKELGIKKFMTKPINFEFLKDQILNELQI